MWNSISGYPRKFDFTPKDHLQLGADLKILDFDSVPKLPIPILLFIWWGRSFGIGLAQFTLNLLKKEGLHLSSPGFGPIPLLKNLGTGYAPRRRSPNPPIEGQDLGLIATAVGTFAVSMCRRNYSKKLFYLLNMLVILICFPSGSRGLRANIPKVFTSGPPVFQNWDVYFFVFRESEKSHQLIPLHRKKKSSSP